MAVKTFTVLPDLSKVDDALTRSVLICLFTDKRVETEDLPYQTDTNGGWWGDVLPLSSETAGDNYSWGSRLWLLERAKIDAATAQDIDGMIREALTPLLNAGIIDDVSIAVSRERIAAKLVEVCVTVTLLSAASVTIVSLISPVGVNSKPLQVTAPVPAVRS